MSKSSPMNNQQEPKKWPQRLALAMAIFAFLLFGGGWFLNQKYLREEARMFGTLSPISGQKIWVTGQELFRFEWSGSTNEDTSLEVARDPEFRDLVLDAVGPKSPYLTDKIPGEGDYYYRLVRHNNGEVVTLLEPVRFTVITMTAPQLIYPFGAMNSQEGKVMRFYWQAKHGVSKYHFQLSFDQSFKHLLSDFVVEETQTTPQNLPVGEFHWRVRGEGDTNVATQWTEARRLRIEGPGSLAKDTEPAKNVVAFTPPPPPATKPVAKVEESVMATPEISQQNQKVILRVGKNKRNIASVQTSWTNPPVLTWKKMKEATSYEVQISPKADFSKLEWSQSLEKNQVTWDKAKPGHYQWRVRAIGKNQVKGSYSSPATLEMSLPAPVLKKKIYTHQVKAKTRAQLTAASQIPVMWDKIPGASSYKVLVSENENFLPSKVDLKVDRNTASVSLTEGGNYFVKVAVLGAEGETVSEFSKASTIKFEKKNMIPAVTKKSEPTLTPTPMLTPAPRAAEPVKNQLAMPQPKLPPNGVSLVSLNGTQDPILFKWAAVEKAEVYRLEIASDEAFKGTIYTTTSRETQIVVTKLLPRGRSFWRVRAEQGSAKSDWSQAFAIEK